MDDLAIGSAEITGDISTILLQLPIHIDDFKVTNLVVSGNEMLAKVLTNPWI